MDKLKAQIIMLSIIMICLVSIVISSIIMMFSIDILSGIIGVIIIIITNTILIYTMNRKPNWEKTLDKYIIKTMKDLESEN